MDKDTPAAMPYGPIKALKPSDLRCLKAADLGPNDYPIGGYSVRFDPEDGSHRDIDGNFFTAKTYLGANGGAADVFFNHTMPIVHQKMTLKAIEELSEHLFTPAKATADEIGLWVETVLDLSDAYEKALAPLIEAGALGWSSSSSAVGARVKNADGAVVHYPADGEIVRWPIVEHSLTPMPAEPRNRVVPVKSFQGIPIQAKTPTPEPITVPVEIDITVKHTTQPTTDEAAVMPESNTPPDGQAAPVTIEAIKALLDAERASTQTMIEEAAKAFTPPPPDVPDDATGGAPIIAKMSNLWKYDNYEDADLAFAHEVLKQASGINGWTGQRLGGPSEDMKKAIGCRVIEHAEKDRTYRPVLGAMKAAGLPLKANELNQSTLASGGDEWVGVTYSRDVWERIVQGSQVVQHIPTLEVPQGSESVIIPLQSTPPTFYKVAQATTQSANPGDTTHTVTTSKLATAQVSLTVGKLGAATTYTGELMEDSFVPFASELRTAIEQESAEVLDHIWIDGDTATATSTNINDIAGTPAGTEAFMLFNGFRKSCLVTTTANSRDGGALAVEDFLETLKLMGLAGKNAIRRDRVKFIIDLWTHWKTLELTEVKTRDVFAQPTIEGGMLTNLFGYDVIATANMHRANQDSTYGLKADALGKIDLDTASDNTKGAILAVRFDQWRMGWKRRMTFELERVPRADAYEVTALMRVGGIQRDTEASAISYNITL